MENVTDMNVHIKMTASGSKDSNKVQKELPTM